MCGGGSTAGHYPRMQILLTLLLTNLVDASLEFSCNMIELILYSKLFVIDFNLFNCKLSGVLK